MKTEIIKDWCLITDINLFEKNYCFECKFMGETDCIKKKIISIFNEEEDKITEFILNND